MGVFMCYFIMRKEIVIIARRKKDKLEFKINNEFYIEGNLKDDIE